MLAVDRDPLHLRMAEVNAEVHRVSDAVSPVLADVRDVQLPDAGAVFVDPARRAEGSRMRASESEPPLAWCVGLAERTAAVGVKATPAEFLVDPNPAVTRAGLVCVEPKRPRHACAPLGGGSVVGCHLPQAKPSRCPTSSTIPTPCWTSSGRCSRCRGCRRSAAGW